MNLKVNRRSAISSLVGAAAGSAVYTSEASKDSPKSLDDRVIGEETIRIIDYVPLKKRAAIWASNYIQTDLKYDLTAAWKAARTYGDSLSGSVVYELPRGKLKMDIDASDDSMVSFSRSICIKGQGRGVTVITATGSGKPIINLAGRNRAVLRDFSIEAESFQAPCAIYMARLSKSPNCNNNKFLDLEIVGNYSAHAVVSCGAESSLWSNVKIAPQNSTGRVSAFWTGIDPTLCGIAAPDGAEVVSGPNTDNRMVNCEIYAAGQDGCVNFTLSHGAGWVFDNVAHIFGQANLTIAYKIQCDASGVFNGPVFINHNHFEVFGANNKGIYVAGSGLNYVYNVHLNGGNAVVDGGYNIVDFDRDQNLASGGAYWLGSSLIMPSVPGTLTSGLPAYIWAMSSSRVWWHERLDARGEFVVFSFASHCHIDAASPAIGASVCSTIVSWAEGLPTSGTFCRGQAVNQTWSSREIADGQPSQVICKKLGTVGVLHNGETTASVRNGSRTISFSSSSGLKVGQVLAIGGHTYRLAILDGTSGKLSVDYLGKTNSAESITFEATGFFVSGSLGLGVADAVQLLTGIEDLPTVIGKINELIRGQISAKQMLNNNEHP